MFEEIQMTKPIDSEYCHTLHRQRRELLALLRTTELTCLKQGIHHQQIIPEASYSPWKGDQQFLRLYELARNNTLVDIYRCYELWALVLRTNSLRGSVAEIGVWRGGTAAILAAASKQANAEQPIHLFDTFSGVVKASEDQDTLYRGGEHADTSESVVVELMTRLQLNNFQIHSGVFPDNTGLTLPKHIRCCHVDVDTYGSAKSCMDFVWPRITIGGVLVFDDYGFWGCEGVTELLDKESPDNSLLIHNLNGHGILVKISSD